jgi:hypothetical protein
MTSSKSKRSTPRAAGSGTKPDAGPALDKVIQSRIGAELRGLYDEFLNQGVPDRFTELLNRLDQSGKERS